MIVESVDGWIREIANPPSWLTYWENNCESSVLELGEFSVTRGKSEESSPWICCRFEEPTLLLSIHIHSNAKFVEFYASSHQRDDCSYITTIRCGQEPGADNNDTYLGESGPSNIKVLTAKLKFLSLPKSSKNKLCITNIKFNVMTSNLLLRKLKSSESNPSEINHSDSINPSSSPLSSNSEKSTQNPRNHPPNLPINPEEGNRFGPDMLALSIMKTVFLHDISQILDSKLAPIVKRLDRLEEMLGSCQKVVVCSCDGLQSELAALTAELHHTAQSGISEEVSDIRDDLKGGAEAALANAAADGAGGVEPSWSGVDGEDEGDDLEEVEPALPEARGEDGGVAAGSLQEDIR